MLRHLFPIPKLGPVEGSSAIRGPTEKLPPQPLQHVRTNDEYYQLFNDVVISDEFQAAKDYREQVGILCRVLRDETEIPVPYQKIGALFSPPRSGNAIKEQETKYKEGVKANGRPTLLTEEELASLKEEINKTITEEGFPTYEDVSDMIVNLFGKYIALPSVRAIVKRMSEFKVVKARPLESSRYKTNFADIKAFYLKLAEIIAEVPVGWLFNLDETGQQDFVDARDIHVVVPSNRWVSREAVYDIDRNGKRCTALHCISSDGKFTKPLFVLPRKTIDLEIFDEMNPNDVMFAESPTGFINTEIFCTWFDQVFIPHIIEKRNTTGYEGKAVLIMDGFISHHKCVEDPERAKILEENGIIVLFIPPHTSDQIQPLDLVIFNLQKQFKSRFGSGLFGKFTYQTKQIIETYNSLLMASTPHYIKSAFERAGIYRDRIQIVDKVVQPQNHIVNVLLCTNLHEHINPEKLPENTNKNEFLESLRSKGGRKTYPIKDLLRFYNKH